MSRLEDETYALLKEVEQSATSKKKNHLSSLATQPNSASQAAARLTPEQAKETPEAYTKRALLEASPEVTPADIARARAAKQKLVGVSGATGVGIGSGIAYANSEE